ncbi:MAG: hypothetical protein RI885_1113 [Actinomycetota bacterium]
MGTRGFTSADHTDATPPTSSRAATGRLPLAVLTVVAVVAAMLAAGAATGSSSAAGATAAGLAAAGNAATTATITSSGDAAGTSAAAIADAASSVGSAGVSGEGTSGTGSSGAGASSAGASGVGASWSPSGPAVGSWTQLGWSQAPTLTSIQIFADKAPGAKIARGTLRFSDGSTIPVGAVAEDPRFPTIVAFPPKTVSSVRFTIEKTSGAGAVAIAEIVAATKGSTPVDASARTGVGSGIGVAVSTPAVCTPTAAGLAATTLTVLCPTSGTVIQGSIPLTVRAPDSTSVEARLWHSPASGSGELAAVTATPDSRGVATLTVDADAAAHGPVTVRVRSITRSGAVQELHLGLFNGGGAPARSWLPKTTSSTTDGMTLAFAEEFTEPLSASRIGDSEFASAKPEWYGAQEFGEAVFADPSAGLDNLTVVDDDYLRISIATRPSTFADPMGWNRAHVGGMLSSGRVGGAGFSAQHGYFEARMLVPAGKGLWPAFWLLPSDNLSVAQDIVAEVDVMENYGQKPTMSCQGTHQYTRGVDTANTLCGTRFGSAQSAVGWHTYGVRVGRDTITYYIDGAVVATAPQIDGGDRPLYFMADLALTGNQWWPVDLAPIGDSAAMYVDYIRVYT